MIKEAYCSDDVCKLLKEKGFKEPCTALNQLVIKDGEKPFMKITHQKAMAWLRENYKLHFAISYNQEYEVSIMTIENNPRCKCRSIVKNTYEEVINAALKYTLENLI